MLDIVSIGEIMVELYSDQPIGSASSFKKGYAGDTCNTVLMAKRLGSSCGYVSLVGEDPFADYLLADLTNHGIDVSRVKRVQGFNGVHFLSILPDGEREFVYYRSGSAASTIRYDDIDQDYIKTANILHISSILQATSPVARDTVLESAKFASRNGVLVSYDTNLRLNMWTLREATKAFREILPYVDVLFPSHPTETFQLLGLDSEHSVIEHCLELGVDTVAVKSGNRGAVIGNKDAIGRVNSIAPAGVVDTTGAGDAFVGGVLYCMAKGYGPFEGARWGVASAGLKIGARGAIAGQPERSAVEKILDQVQIIWE